MNRHLNVELAYVSKGSISYTLDEKKYILGNGNILLVFPFVSHCFEVDADSELFLITFEPVFIEDFKRVFCEYNLTVPNFRKKEIEPSTFHALNQLKQTDERSMIKIKGWMIVILGDLFFKRTLTKKQEKIEPIFIGNILSYIKLHLSDPLLKKNLMKEFGLSDNFLSHTFKQITNTSFNQMKTIISLEYACELLSTTNYSMLSIALECGYNNTQAFTRNFKKYMGISLNEYLGGN